MIFPIIRILDWVKDREVLATIFISAFPELFKSVGSQSNSFLQSYLKLGTVSARHVSCHPLHIYPSASSVCFSWEDNGLRYRGTRELYELYIALRFGIAKCFKQTVRVRVIIISYIVILSTYETLSV